MKRNLIPLLGIAFVVAIAATGVFYGLFVGKVNGAAAQPAAGGNVVAVIRPVDRGTVLKATDVQIRPVATPAPGAFSNVEDVVGQTVTIPLNAFDAVTAKSIAGAGAASSLSIPKGMRAISIRVADSAGLLPFVRSGHRIDVQAVSQNAGQEQVARSILSNVEVLNAHVESSAGGASTTILNLLIAAKDVEKVAQADSLGRVRIVLRNPEDKDEVPTAPARAIYTASVQPAAPRNVRFDVRVGSARTDVIKDMLARTASATPADLRIGTLPRDWNADSGLRSVQVLSAQSIEAANGQEVFLRTGVRDNDYDLRVNLTSRGTANGVVRLRLRPELTIPLRGGTSSRRISADLDLADGQSALLAGFERDAAAPALVGKLFKNAKETEGELLVVVTPRVLAAR